MEKEYAHNPGGFENTVPDKAKTYARDPKGGKAQVKYIDTLRVVSKGITHEIVFDSEGQHYLAVFTEITKGSEKSYVTIPGRLVSYNNGRGKFVKGEVSKVETVAADEEKHRIKEALLAGGRYGRRKAFEGLDIKFWP